MRSLAGTLAVVLLALPAQAAPMLTSSPATPRAIQAQVPASGKPTLAVLPPLGSSYVPYNDSLYARLTSALVNLGRFQVLERGTIQTLITERELSARGYAEPAALGKLLQAQKLLIAEMLTDPSGHAVDYEETKDNRKVHRTRYESLARASVRFIDVHTGSTYEALEVSETATDPVSAEAAKDKAMDQVVDRIVAQIRNRSRLSARVIDRDGWAVTLDAGGDVGLQRGMYLDITDGLGGRAATLCLRSTDGARARAEVVRGYYRVAPGQQAIEDPQGGDPVGLGYVNRIMFSNTAAINTTFNGLQLQTNPLGRGLALGGELGWMGNLGGGDGLAVQLFAAPQFPLIPEHLWTYLSLGVAGEVLMAPTTTGKTASAGGLHAMASLGVGASPVEGLLAFVETGYLTPWKVQDWSVSVGDSWQKVTGWMPTPTVGGVFLRSGVSLAF